MRFLVTFEFCAGDELGVPFHHVFEASDTDELARKIQYFGDYFYAFDEEDSEGSPVESYLRNVWAYNNGATLRLEGFEQFTDAETVVNKLRINVEVPA